MAVRSEENHQGFGARNGELDPALFVGEGPIGEDAESQLFGIERERAVLIGHGDANELNAFNHGSRIKEGAESVNVISYAVIDWTIVVKDIVVDDYVISVLMRDMGGHDRCPSAFLVYLHLWGESQRLASNSVPASHQAIAEATGLSKSAVQKAVRYLVERKLLRAQKASVTATPEYRVLRTWRR